MIVVVVVGVDADGDGDGDVADLVAGPRPLPEESRSVLEQVRGDRAAADHVGSCREAADEELAEAVVHAQVGVGQLAPARPRSVEPPLP